MPKLHYTALSPEQMLERALGERAEIVARPQRTPKQVLGMWMENAGAGVGVGLALGCGLYWLGAPESTALSTASLSSAIVFGVLMAWRGSADERAMWWSDRRVKSAVKAITADAHARTERSQAQLAKALDELDDADRVEAQLRRSLDEMTRQRDRAVSDLAHEREHVAQRGGHSNYVAPVEMAPQDIRDATEMIRFYYDTGEHLSRRKATDKARGLKRWTEPQWDKAKGNLDEARVIRVIEGQTEYPDTLDEALATFGEYMLHAKRLSVPTINKTVGFSLYVESENG